MTKQQYKVSVELTIPSTWTTISDDIVVKASSNQEAKELAKAKMLKTLLCKKNWKAKVVQKAPAGRDID